MLGLQGAERIADVTTMSRLRNGSYRLEQLVPRDSRAWWSGQEIEGDVEFAFELALGVVSEAEQVILGAFSRCCQRLTAQIVVDDGDDFDGSAHRDPRGSSALRAAFCHEFVENGCLKAIVLSRDEEDILVGPDILAAQQLARKFSERCQEQRCRPLLLSSEARRREISLRFRKPGEGSAVLCRAELTTATEVVDIR